MSMMASSFSHIMYVLLVARSRLLLASLSTSLRRTAVLVSTHTSTVLPVMKKENVVSSGDGAGKSVY